MGALAPTLTWRWKLEKWMSGMKRTGCVSKSLIILKVVTSFFFCSSGTLTSATGGQRARGQ